LTSSIPSPVARVVVVVIDRSRERDIDTDARATRRVVVVVVVVVVTRPDTIFIGSPLADAIPPLTTRFPATTPRADADADAVIVVIISTVSPATHARRARLCGDVAIEGTTYVIRTTLDPVDVTNHDSSDES
jgi:hypothetical protein